MPSIATFQDEHGAKPLAGDQAQGLRVARSPLVVIASGKGGVGKTFVSIHLALALRDRGDRPVLADLDWGLANVDVALGLAPRRHLGHYLAGEAQLEDIALNYAGLTLIPNGCGEQTLAAAPPQRQTELLNALRTRTALGNVVLADTHPGLGATSRELLPLADLVLLVTTPEPTSLTDTYALYKLLAESGGTAAVGLIVNQAGTPEQGLRAADHLTRVTRRFLGKSPDYWGSIETDAAAPRAVQRQQPLDLTAGGPAAASILRLAEAVQAYLSPLRKSGRNTK